MSTYPSTATLAAFRRSIDQHNGNTGYNTRAYISHPTFLADGLGAWPHEREHGIGYRRTFGLPEFEPRMMRREASALRSRAYERGLITIRGLDGSVKVRYQQP